MRDRLVIIFLAILASLTPDVASLAQTPAITRTESQRIEGPNATHVVETCLVTAAPRPRSADSVSVAGFRIRPALEADLRRGG